MTFSNETQIELICLQLRQHVVLAANRNLERITSQTTFTQQQYKRSFYTVLTVAQLCSSFSTTCLNVIEVVV